MVHGILLDAYEDPDGADVLPAPAVVVVVDTSISSSGASCFLGLLRSSSVIPSSLVIPTTGASPFFTNSHWPVTQLVVL